MICSQNFQWIYLGDKSAKHVDTMYTRERGRLYVLLFNDFEKIRQYSDEKSAKLLSLNFNFGGLIRYYVHTGTLNLKIQRESICFLWGIQVF